LLDAVYYFGKANESSAEDPSDKTKEPQVSREGGQSPTELSTDSKGDMDSETLKTSPPPTSHEEEDLEVPTEPNLDVD